MIENPKLTSETRLHGCPIPIVGLTGGIAVGKSTVANMLTSYGLNVINADALVKEIYATPSSFQFVKQNFPHAIKGKSIDFTVLRKVAFGSQDSRTMLENFIYAQLPERFLSHVPANAGLIIYDIPLLFEKKVDRLVDFTVCVYVPRSVQRARLIARDGIDEALADSILAAQMDIEEKRSKAHVVIDNTKGMAELEGEVKKFLANLDL